MPFCLALRPIERIERRWATLSAGTIDQTTGILEGLCQNTKTSVNLELSTELASGPKVSTK